MSDRDAAFARALKRAQPPAVFDRRRSDADALLAELTRRARDPHVVFDDVLEIASDPAVLHRAWELTSGSRGRDTPGIDGATSWRITSSRGGVAQLLDGIREDLQALSFAPRPYRLCAIPQSGGKVRELCIPTIRDRVVQRALLLTLAPVFEPTLSSRAFAYRPGVDARSALDEIRRTLLVDARPILAVTTDVEGFFDSIAHELVLRSLKLRVVDGRFEKILRRLLRAGVRSHGRTAARRQGIPQGGPLSPLLSNIVLSSVDQSFERGANHSYLRYADDILILVAGAEGDARDVLGRLESNVASLGLQLKSSKTVIANVDEGFTFLGHHVRRYLSPDPINIEILPSVANIERIAEYSRVRIDGRLLDVHALAEFDPRVRGWLAYFDRSPTAITSIQQRLEPSPSSAIAATRSEAQMKKKEPEPTNHHDCSSPCESVEPPARTDTSDRSRPRRLSGADVAVLLQGGVSYVAMYQELSNQHSYIVETEARAKIELGRIRIERENLETALRTAARSHDPAISRYRLQDIIRSSEVHQNLVNREFEANARLLQHVAERRALQAELATLSRFVELRRQDIEALRTGENLVSRGSQKSGKKRRRR